MQALVPSAAAQHPAQTSHLHLSIRLYLSLPSLVTWLMKGGFEVICYSTVRHSVVTSPLQNASGFSKDTCPLLLVAQSCCETSRAGTHTVIFTLGHSTRATQHLRRGGYL